MLLSKIDSHLRNERGLSLQTKDHARFLISFQPQGQSAEHPGHGPGPQGQSGEGAAAGLPPGPYLSIHRDHPAEDVVRHHNGVGAESAQVGVPPLAETAEDVIFVAAQAPPGKVRLRLRGADADVLLRQGEGPPGVVQLPLVRPANDQIHVLSSCTCRGSAPL